MATSLRNLDPASAASPAPACRFCSTPLRRSLVDLGVSPPSNAYLKPEDLARPETFYPLHARVCERCFLVQIEAFQRPDEIFDGYRYFSSYSSSWLRHCEIYAGQTIERFGLDARSQVVEVASNDGYLLQYFKARGIPVLGIEPASNVAEFARTRGIPTHARFFGSATAEDLRRDGIGADLLAGNNVLAHVPELNDFVRGLSLLLNPGGVLTMEFPHLLRLMAETQFDTIYHEHFSYFSLLTVERLFARHGIALFDVEELPTHGGSLRIYGAPAASGRPVCAAIGALKARERDAGLDRLAAYAGFAREVHRVKRDLLRFMVDARDAGKSVVGFGAAAKGNTLLNYCGIGPELLDYVVDSSPHKQGLFLPGSRIAIHAPERILRTQPDYVLILPWNLKHEISAEAEFIRDWGGKFVVPIPRLEILP